MKFALGIVVGGAALANVARADFYFTRAAGRNDGRTYSAQSGNYNASKQQACNQCLQANSSCDTHTDVCFPTSAGIKCNSYSNGNCSSR